jgi:hypothetical protein
MVALITQRADLSDRAERGRSSLPVLEALPASEVLTTIVSHDLSGTSWPPVRAAINKLPFWSSRFLAAAHSRSLEFGLFRPRAVARGGIKGTAHCKRALGPFRVVFAPEPVPRDAGRPLFDLIPEAYTD